MYLKLKAQMLPYYYSYARESYDTGVPMVRALMLEYPEEEFTMGNQTQYEYLWGENLLVAPVYDEAENNAEVRNKIYLPGGEDQVWIDYFTGEQYTGGKVVNSIDAPLWKLPLFVKSGAIIPMTVENNSVQELTGEEPRIFDVYRMGILPLLCMMMGILRHIRMVKEASPRSLHMSRMARLTSP